MDKSRLTRRKFLARSASLGSVAVLAPGAFAEKLLRTPRITEGPFYPDELPLDTDNDLLLINDAIAPAVGEITHLGGRILGLNGQPVRNAVVEIWQVDSRGVYLHTDSANRIEFDTNFQGFGRFLTSSTGEYYFRTIKPVAYGSRTPHIHMIVKKGDKRLLATQLFIKDDPRNEEDGLVRRIRDPKALESVMVDFVPIEDSDIGELSARCDVVLGLTPEEADGRGRAKS